MDGGGAGVWQWTALGHQLRAALARTCITLAAGVLLALGSCWAHASGLSVAPTQLDFAAGESVQGLHLHNTGKSSIHAQLRLFAWAQKSDGSDVLTPSTALVVSPPILNIAPDQRQLVRVVRTRASGPPAAREQSYRLLIDELPPAAVEPGVSRPGLNLVLRFSVPVFVAADLPPAAPSRARVSLRFGTAGAVGLNVENPTSRRLQLADLRIFDAQGQAVFTKPGLLGYVLAGNQRRWRLEPDAKVRATATEMQIRINGETVRQPLSALPLEWPAP